MLILVI